MNDAVLEAIRTRRVCRSMSDEPVERGQLEAVLEAARWAPSAGNRRLQRFVVSDDPALLRVLRAVCPGMIARAPAAVAICNDLALAEDYGFADTAPGLWVDVGTAAATMLLAVQALGLGAVPVTSFSRAAVSVVLELPERWRPELIICVGHPTPAGPAPMARGRVTWRDLTRFVPAG